MNHGRTLIVIRERSFLDLLDLAFVVIRARPAALALTAAVGIGPFAFLNYWLFSVFLAGESHWVLWILLLLLEAPWATAPLTIVLGDLMFEARPGVVKIAKILVSSFPSLFFTQLLIRGLALLSVFGSVLLPARLSFLNEAILLERVGPIRALGRSSGMSRGFGGELLLRWIGNVALGATFALCFQNGSEKLGSVLAGGELTWDPSTNFDASDALFETGVWIAIAFFTVVKFLTYIDRRTRLEGWEIALRLKHVGRTLEERQW